MTTPSLPLTYPSKRFAMGTRRCGVGRSKQCRMSPLRRLLRQGKAAVCALPVPSLRCSTRPYRTVLNREAIERTGTLHAELG